MNKILFIVNPISGGKSKLAFIKRIGDLLNTDKWDYKVVISKYPNHAREIASSTSAEIVVAVGGDGTVNEVASGLVSSDKILGIIPFGSGNGLARHIGLGSNPYKAIDIINKHHINKIDVGVVNDRYFFCTTGVGFDAQVDAHYSSCGKRGLYSYVCSALKEWRNYNPKIYNINVDGRCYNLKASMVTIGNANQWGNNSYITPNASLSDGLLDIAIVKPFEGKDIIPLAVKLFTKQLTSSNLVHYDVGKTITVSGNNLDWAHFDGEPFKCRGEITYSVLKQALCILTPKVCKL